MIRAKTNNNKHMELEAVSDNKHKLSRVIILSRYSANNLHTSMQTHQICVCIFIYTHLNENDDDDDDDDNEEKNGNNYYY